MHPLQALLLCPLVALTALHLSAQGSMELTERGGSKLFLDDDGRLHRVQPDGHSQPIGCTLRHGPGRIHDMVRDPQGGTCLAAEKGLFSISSSVDVLDPFDLRDGVPLGEPIELRYGGDRRLFVRTKTSFGVIDLRYSFGRNIEWKGSASDYLADQADPPALRVIAVGGQGYAPDRIYRAEMGQKIQLRLDEQARGGASFRYRRHGHHLWYPLDADRPTLTIGRPGSMAVEVIALDQDLRRSRPIVLRFEIPYPFYFSKTFLLGSACGGGLAIFTLFGILAWRSGGGKKRIAKALLSAIALSLLTIQGLAALFPHAKAWPFVGFSMYTEHYEEFGLLYQPGLWAQSVDGHWFAAHPNMAGRASDGYWQALLPLVYGDDESRRAFVADFNRLNPGSPIRGVLVQEKRTRLTTEGPVRVSPVVMMRYPEAAR